MQVVGRWHYIQSPPKVLEQQNTEYIWGWDKKRQVQNFSFYSLAFTPTVDVLNYLYHSTFGIRPPDFYMSKSIGTKII